MSLAVLLALTLPLAQTPVFRCTSTTGAVSYQDVPCARDESSVELKLAPVPDYVPAVSVEAPNTELDREAEPRLPPPAPLPPAEPRAWRCIADNGEVFYRHDGCPATLSIVVLNPYAQAFANTGLIYVDSVPIRRSEACAAITAGGRFGAERDQRAAPYEKLTGRDLCR